MPPLASPSPRGDALEVQEGRAYQPELARKIANHDTLDTSMVRRGLRRCCSVITGSKLFEMHRYRNVQWGRSVDQKG
jgi:hypothetical protein